MNAEAFEGPRRGGRVATGRRDVQSESPGFRRLFGRGIARVLRVSILIAGLLAAIPATSGAAAENWELELVSPQRSGGKNIWTAWGAASGESAFFYTELITAEVFVSERGDHGWLSSARDQVNVEVMPKFEDASPDMSRIVLRDGADVRRSGVIYKEAIYVREAGEVATVAAWDEYSGRPSSYIQPAEYLGGSDDKKTLFVFAADETLIGAAPSPTGLYRWTGGPLEPIDIPEQRFQDCPTTAMVGNMEFFAGSVRRRLTSLMQNGISADGSTFVVAPQHCSSGVDQYPTHLYLFRDGMAPIDITKPVAGNDGPSTFVGMTREGDRVFLTSAARLTADDTDANVDLYLWENGALTRITGHTMLEDLTLTNTMVSPDGSTVWMVARTTDSPAAHGLYTWRDGVVNQVAELAGALAFAGADDKNPTQLAYDGSALLVLTTPNIIGTPAAGPTQAYRISIDGQIDCVSCTAAGAATHEAVLSSSELGPMQQKTAWPDPRISADGSTIAFETAAALAPKDTNGKVDVYVWRDGRHELISSGTVGEDAVAMGMSWDGRTVYFRSWGALIPGSIDAYRKLYAARLGGGFPPPATAGACGADCQGPVTAAPRLPVIGSVNFSGDGNVSTGPQPTRAAVRVARLRPVNGARARLRVRVSAPGRVAVAGPAIRRFARATPRAGTFSLPVALNLKARQRLIRNKRLNVRARVIYRAGGGGRAVQRVAVTFRLSHANRAGRKGGR